MARAAFEERVAEASAADPWLRDHPVRVAWSGGQFASGRYAGAGADGSRDDHWLLPTLQDAVADVTGGVRPRRRGAPYGSDLRLYNAAGIPSIHYGPGDVRHAHSAIEQVRLSEVGVTARALVLTALRAPTHLATCEFAAAMAALRLTQCSSTGGGYARSVGSATLPRVRRRSSANVDQRCRQRSMRPTLITSSGWGRCRRQQAGASESLTRSFELHVAAGRWRRLHRGRLLHGATPPRARSTPLGGVARVR